MRHFPTRILCASAQKICKAGGHFNTHYKPYIVILKKSIYAPCPEPQAKPARQQSAWLAHKMYLYKGKIPPASAVTPAKPPYAFSQKGHTFHKRHASLEEAEQTGIDLPRNFPQQTPTPRLAEIAVADTLHHFASGLPA